MTQVALAETLGVTQGYISEIERGTRGAPPELLTRIAEALDCPVDSLERVRPFQCPACGYGHDPEDSGLTPLHTLPGSDAWCAGGGRPSVARSAVAA